MNNGRKLDKVTLHAIVMINQHFSIVEIIKHIKYFTNHSEIMMEGSFKQFMIYEK
jgi:hypothetical protein